MKIPSGLAVVFLLFLGPPALHPAENSAIDRILEGFDGPPETPVPVSEGEKPSSISIDGCLKLGAAYNFAHDAPAPGETDWRGLSRFKPEAYLEVKNKFSDLWQAQLSASAYYDAVFDVRGRENYTDAVLDNREKDLEFGESYLLGSLTDRLDLKFGRQIVVWGKSDNIRITDVINPLDLREPGLVDIETLRLPITLTKLNHYRGNWGISAMAVHEVRFNKEPAFGSDFFPGTEPPPPEVVPSETLDNTQWAASLSGIFSGWDIAFYLSQIYNALPHQEIGPGGGKVRKHARLNMAGAAWNAAFGNWLLKAETAFLDGLKFFNDPGETRSRLDALAGFEYTGLDETVISFEAANRHLFDFTDTLKSPPDSAERDEFQWVFRLRREFMHDTFAVTVLAQTFGLTGQGGAFQRLSAEYDVTDAVQLSGGVIFYHSGDLRRFKTVGDNDRIFLEIKYSF